MKPVKTRFAPSPTGYLHIGGARTALFSWAYAQQQGGQFFLRIEDTDAVRSDAAHSQAIIDAMDWLGITADAAPMFQSANLQRHQTIIQQLIDNGNAYYCYASPEELQALRQAQQARGENPKYDRRWRDSNDTPPVGVAPAVRFKMPLDGDSTFDDATKSTLSVANSELDDFIIARADGAPTYNLAAVVDDIDMEITHVIRGDDHVMNTYRQWHLFQAIAAMENKAIP
nr:glutamate--tRNA ligase [Pseudomonadota bacterium]